MSILAIILIILLLGGFGGAYVGPFRGYGGRWAGPGLGTILLIVLILALIGRI
jgi:hypothetical protein